jgi:hypothetical protein
MTDIHHIGYVVDDLQAAIPQAIATLGTGPFFLIEHMTFDETTYRGGLASYDHSSGFAAVGDLLIELTQVHGAQPPELREALGGTLGIGHVGYVVDDQAAEVARLETQGLRAFHTGRTGPASAVWLESDWLGHHVEVLQSAPPLLSFYASIRAAADGWDGSDPIRRRG